MQLRQDPLTGSWVLIAESRAARPHDYQVTVRQRRTVECPFCRGSESATPEALAVYPPNGGLSVDGQTEWQVRVVPNKYPAVGPEALMGERPESGGLVWLPAVGRHEVIIEAPGHVASLTELTDEQLWWTFVAYQDRLRALTQVPQVAYGQVFKNVGHEAGASLEHVHSQLLALPIVPPRVADKLARCRAAWEQGRACPLCELMERELDERVRLVAESAANLAWCPFASRFPYEVWVAPKIHAARFEDAEADTLRDTAQLVREMVGRLESILPELSYNYCLFTSPVHPGFSESKKDSPQLDSSSPVRSTSPGGDACFHWHVELLPRLTKAAGFEWATGMCINPVAPETAARKLRLGSCGSEVAARKLRLGSCG